MASFRMVMSGYECCCDDGEIAEGLIVFGIKLIERLKFKRNNIG